MILASEVLVYRDANYGLSSTDFGVRAAGTSPHLWLAAGWQFLSYDFLLLPIVCIIDLRRFEKFLQIFENSTH